MAKLITDKPLAQHIESLIFSSEQPLAFDEIHQCLEQALELTLSKNEIKKTIDALVEDIRHQNSASKSSK